MYSNGTRTGTFEPKHREKYIGKKPEIVYRSSWEQRMMQFCDNNPNVVRWSYEDIKIAYLKPQPNGTMRKANYIPDFYIEYINRQGEMKKELLEVKPNKQTKRSKTRNVSQRMYENYIYAVNMSKWQAAERWAQQNGVVFRVVTEVSIFGA